MNRPKGQIKIIKTLEGILGHEFSEPGLLFEALTHPSLEGEPNYQRLEFLGDRVLGLVIGALVFETYPGDGEGRLSRRYAALVRKETLAKVAADLKLANLIRMSETTKRSGGKQNPSILSDVLEALIGALYVDGGFKCALAFIRRAWKPYLSGKTVDKDPKTGLQEWAQGRGKPLPVYEQMERKGPDHSPSFVVRVSVPGLGSAKGEGSSKQIAETRAAEKLLAKGQKA